MSLEIVRKIRGNLNGSIDISRLEDLVIAHPIFQRLRRIKQTAFLSYVFPGATHCRFEHSLGVMNNTQKAWGKIYSNQIRLMESSKRYHSFARRERESKDGIVHGLLAPTFPLIDAIFSSDYILQSIRLAGLLHDLGHPPYSHSGERFLPTLGEILKNNPAMPSYIRDFLETRLKNAEEKSPELLKKPVSHEIYSILLIDKVLNEIYDKKPGLKLMVSPQDVVAILCPEIKPTSGSPLQSLHALEVCHELVSGELDMDRVDYLQRDSRECGVVYGVFDEERIMDSLCVYFDERDNRMHLAILFSGLAAFEDYLRSRQSMYVQLYFHKTAVACEAMLQTISKIVPSYTLPANLDDYAGIDETNFHQELKQYGTMAIKEPSEKDRYVRLLQDLFLDRVLYKRVYEVSTILPKGNIEYRDLNLAEKILAEKGYAFEKISTANVMTRITPRKKMQESLNHLRLIKKDARQFPRVEPIEDYSRFLGRKSMVEIHRLYVDNYPKESGKPTAFLAKEALMQGFAEAEYKNEP